MAEYPDNFALSDAELGCTSWIQHSVDTGNHAPIKQQPYRTPIIRRAMIAEMVDDMRKQGIVQPSVSPWASPIVLVPKKDGTYHFCVDFCRLNTITKKDIYPLPRIDDILDTLGESKFSSPRVTGKLNSLPIRARNLPSPLTVDCLNLCACPLVCATFQRLMQKVLAGLEWRTCFVNLDDILIASCLFDEHLRHLREVFTRLRDAGLCLKPCKCNLLLFSVTSFPPEACALTQQRSRKSSVTQSPLMLLKSGSS